MPERSGTDGYAFAAVDHPLIGTGRDADVFDRGDGTVLRRYRRRSVPAREVAIMRYVRDHGYPVPRVVSVSGSDLVLEKVVGPTMQDDLAAVPSRIPEHAALLARLHDELHAIVAPAWLAARDDGDRILHLDLHPRNVLLSPSGPVVIDWANAARGPASLDPALAIAIFTSAKAHAGPEERALIVSFIEAFAQHFEPLDLRASMPLAVRLRADDPNVTDPERAELATLMAWDE